MSDELEDLIAAIRSLTPAKQEQLGPVVAALGMSVNMKLNRESDFADPDFASRMGAVLQLHHAFSREPFTKDKFEFAMEATLLQSGHQAELASKGNPGHDLTVDGVRISLKTQADRNIRADQIHISKYMELGRGQWVTEDDLYGLRDRMFDHMRSYERIFTLRCLTPNDDVRKVYELVEIPKALLEASAAFPCEMMHTSKQTPKPGYCRVSVDGRPAFELYFDGGTERKLQVRKLQVSLCTVHATWAITL